MLRIDFLVVDNCFKLYWFVRIDRDFTLNFINNKYLVF